MEKESKKSLLCKKDCKKCFQGLYKIIKKIESLFKDPLSFFHITQEQYQVLKCQIEIFILLDNEKESKFNQEQCIQFTKINQEKLLLDSEQNEEQQQEDDDDDDDQGSIQDEQNSIQSQNINEKNGLSLQETNTNDQPHKNEEQQIGGQEDSTTDHNLNLPILQEIKKKCDARKEFDFIVRFKDSLIFALIGSGLSVKELILEKQYIQLEIVGSLKRDEYLQSFAKYIFAKLSLKMKVEEQFEISKNKTGSIFQFLSTFVAKKFFSKYQELLTNSQMDRYYQNIILKPIVPSSYFASINRKNQRCYIIAEWSISPSQRMAVIHFSNEIDANSTEQELIKNKSFKVKVISRYDEKQGEEISIVQVERLPILFDEIDLDPYISNLYQGHLHSQIRREKSYSTHYKELQSLESREKTDFLSFLQLKCPHLFKAGSYIAPDETRIEIKNGRCSAKIQLNSTLTCQQVVNVLNGVTYKEQKLRIHIENERSIPVIGSVYLLFQSKIIKLFDDAPTIKYKIPLASEIIFKSNPIQIHISQSQKSSLKQLNDLCNNINMIIKPSQVKIDCDPSNLNFIIQNHYQSFQNLYEYYGCICLQTATHLSILKVWFKENNSDSIVSVFQKEIQSLVNSYLLVSDRFQIFNKDKNWVIQYLNQLQKQNLIKQFTLEDNNIINIQLSKQKEEELKIKFEDDQINSNSKYSRKGNNDGVCLICLDQTLMKPLQCECLLCQDCLLKYLISEKQNKIANTPIGCPNHLEIPISVKYLEQNLGKQNIDDIIMERIDIFIDQKLLSEQKQQYIRCPNPRCLEIFQRFYQKDNSKYNQIIQKCGGCFEEYCLASSGNYNLPYEQQIHLAHEHQCSHYFKEIRDEATNLKGLKMIQCPNCKFQAIKGDGCNHISCKCGTHYCAKCLDSFSTPKEVYDHLIELHQGINN